MSVERQKRVGRQKTGCVRLETKVPNSVAAVNQRPPQSPGALPAQEKWPGFAGTQLSPVGEEKPGRQLHLYLPGMFLQTELGPHGEGLGEHSSTSRQRKNRSYKFVSFCIKGCIFQRWS